MYQWIKEKVEYTPSRFFVVHNRAQDMGLLWWLYNSIHQ